MASSGGRTGTGVGVGGPQLYFCHQCNRTVSISPSPTSELVCPDCNGGFLEEYDSPDVSPMFNPFFPFDSFFGGSAGSGGGMGVSSGTGLVLTPFSGGAGGGGMGGIGARFGGASAFNENNNNNNNPDAFNPLLFLLNHLQTLRADGANIQFVINNNPGDGGSFRIPGNINLGDYFIGSNLEQLIQQLAENDPNRSGNINHGDYFNGSIEQLIQQLAENDPNRSGNINHGDYFNGSIEQLIQQLAENDPNRYGTPPATKSAINGLPVVNITKELLTSDNSQCAVCLDTFELGEEAMQMPCEHIYHSGCILPWLALHNTCPVCRYELHTEDPGYEQRNMGPQAQQVSGNRGQSDVSSDLSGAPASGENPRTPQTMERRFRISLPFPWPFRASGSPAETSDSGSGSGNNNGNNDGNSNAGDGVNRNFESETRQEDLD